MRSKVAKRILEQTPQDVEIFARMYGDLVVRINSLLKEKGYTQKKLADRLEKKPSEISKWLNGQHNFTLRSLAKLEAELGSPLIYIPKTIFKSSGSIKSSFTVYSNVQRPQDLDFSKFEDKKIKQSNEYANVS